MAWVPGRFVVISGAPTAGGSPVVPTSTPAAGGRVDGTDGSKPPGGSYAAPGTPALLDTGGAFSAGDPISTDGQGRAVQAGSGDMKVAEALEGSSGSGDSAWVVFVTQEVV